jgi:hypothetical protein
MSVVKSVIVDESPRKEERSKEEGKEEEREENKSNRFCCLLTK